VAAPTVSVAAAVDLVLAYPREILGPPRPLPAPRVNGVIHRRPLPAGHSLSDDRMGLPLTADLLHEVDVESIGNLRWLKQVGAALFAPGGPTAAQVLPAPPDTLVRRLNDALLMPSAAANSWFASPARLLNSVDTVLDPAYLSRWLVRMLIGAGKPVPLVVPGLVYGTHGTFEIMADIRHWRVANPLAPGPAAGPAGVLPNTIVKDFQRAIRNAVSSISGSHGWSGNVTPLSLTWALNADSVPDPAAPGVLNKLMVPIVTAGLSARRGVGANSAGQKMLVEAGDKHTGRSMTRIEVTSVDWHLAWRPDTGEGEVFKTTVDGEAIVVYVPTQNVPPLLALAPKVALPIGPPPRASYPPRPSATARPPYPRLTRGPATSRTSEPSTSRLAMDHREPLDTWVSIMDWAESATFFASHQNELVTAGNREALAARTPATDPGRWGILAALLAEEFGGWAGLGYDYLVAATPEEGIKQVLPALVRWPVLFAPTAELVDAVSVVRGDGGYHAVLLRATRHALAGETEAARALVKSVRGRVLPSVKISWIDLLAPLAEPTQPDSAAVNALREELTGCAIPTRNPPQ
jgi:hypothetical protein